MIITGSMRILSALAVTRFPAPRPMVPSFQFCFCEARMRIQGQVSKFSIILVVAGGLVLCSGVPDAVWKASTGVLDAAWRTFTDGTVYAPGFSEAGFNEIKAGMTEAEVIGLLGQPLGRITEEGETFMHYSGPMGVESSFYVRMVLLGKDGRVLKVSTGFIDEFW